jgi:two-component system, NtrC family, nitrogen regulation response regulator NtrX
MMSTATNIDFVPAVLELMGYSPSIERARSVMTRAAQGLTPLMISAESGLDPLAVARAIHDAGARARGPFVVMDCASPGAVRLDQQLFGSPPPVHPSELESVTEDSLLGSAFGGTLVIAALAELPSPLQSRLGRALRDRQVHRAHDGTVPLDVMIMATVRGNVEDEIREGKLRRELCLRFGVNLELPALRHRAADIPQLIGRVAADAAGAAKLSVPAFSPEALLLLAALPWRRNFDELREVLDELVRAAAGSTIHLDDVLGHVPIERTTTHQPGAASLRDARTAFEREYIAAALSRHGWRMDVAARTLGIQRTNLYRKVRQLGIARARSQK